MCSDPEHTKEFRNIAETMVRMETKLDNVLTVVGDHEARLRVAEASIIVHNDNKPDYEQMRKEIKRLSEVSAKNKATVDGWSKALWVVGTAAFAGLGASIWEALRNSFGQ